MSARAFTRLLDRSLVHLSFFLSLRDKERERAISNALAMQEIKIRTSYYTNQHSKNDYFYYLAFDFSNDCVTNFILNAPSPQSANSVYDKVYMIWVGVHILFANFSEKRKEKRNKANKLRKKIKNLHFNNETSQQSLYSIITYTKQLTHVNVTYSQKWIKIKTIVLPESSFSHTFFTLICNGVNHFHLKHSSFLHCTTIMIGLHTIRNPSAPSQNYDWSNSNFCQDEPARMPCIRIAEHLSIYNGKSLRK